MNMYLLALLLSCQTSMVIGAPPVVEVRAVGETAPVEHPEDAADDPAIWVDRDDPGRSLILGTNKQGGLCVHDLSGRLLQFLPVGRINNVDVRQGVRAGEGGTIDIAVASHRERRAVSVFAIRATADGPRVEELPGSPFAVGVAEPYGICLARDAESGAATVYVNDKAGLIEAWRLDLSNPSEPGATLERSFKLSSQVEGMVVDDARNVLFVGEETVGVWRIDLSERDPVPALVMGASAAGPLVPDVEGVAIARLVGGRDLLLVSSQGNNTFLALDLEPPHGLRGVFAIGSGDFGGAEDTDGIEVCVLPLGPDFPGGVFIAQDGMNEPSHQNFKLVRWGDIVGALGLAP
jgi:3-phytase